MILAILDDKPCNSMNLMVNLRKAVSVTSMANISANKIINDLMVVTGCFLIIIFYKYKCFLWKEIIKTVYGSFAREMA